MDEQIREESDPRMVEEGSDMGRTLEDRMKETYRNLMALTDAEGALNDLTFPEWKLMTARKMHICVACGHAVRIGEKYFGQHAWPPMGPPEPPWLPLRFHEDCQDKPMQKLEQPLPHDTLLDLKTGDVFEGNPAPFDWEQVEWSRDTASRAYFMFVDPE